MSDITIIYSGGSQNTGQKDSLGGFPSYTEIGDEVNNLFNNVVPKQTSLGQIDYKCFYIFNDSDFIKYQITLYTDFLSDEGSDLTLGLLFQNEVQKLEFIGNPTGGTFQISIQGFTTRVITWVSDNTALAAAIKSALDEKVGGDCTVTVSSTNIFLITFGGDLGYKSLSDLAVTNNQLTPLGTITEDVSRVQFGSPINTIAPDTGDTNLAPVDVPFTSIVSPGMIIGVLYPSEGFPVWVRRVVAPESVAVAEDGCNLQIKTIGTIVD